MKDKVLIIDGLNFIYRGVIKFNKKLDDSIDYTIVYNFFRNLKSIIEQMAPNRCLFALEGNPQFRKDLFPDYKKNRLTKYGVLRKEVLRQADEIVRLIKYLPITCVRADAYEADDIIYSLSQNLRDEDVTIVSTDSDLIQVIQKLSKHDVKLFNATTKSYISTPPYVYLVWKSIAGDKSDNIPGIKSSQEAEEIASSPKLLVDFLSSQENLSNFNLNRKLIELQNIPDKEIILTPPQINYEHLFSEFQNLGFKSLVKEEYRNKFISVFSENLQNK